MDVEKQRQVLVLMVTGVIIIVVVSVLLLINVWTREESEIEEEYTYEVGKLDDISNVTEDDIVKDYFTKLQIYLLEKNIDKIYSYLGQDYIEYSQMTKEKLNEYLENKKILGEELIFTSYEKIAVEGYSNVYILNIKLKNDVYDLKIIIREKSPNDYTYTLEDFIKSSALDYNQTVDGINLQVTKVTQFNNFIDYDIVIKNVHDSTIYLNSATKPEGMYLRIGDSLVGPYTTVLGTRKIEIEPNRIKQYTIRYKVDNTKINRIMSMVLKDIYYEGRGLTGDVEFVF